MQNGLKLLAGIVIALASGDALAQSVEPMPPRTPSPLTVRQIHSGHSLTDTYMSGPWPGRLILATATRVGRDPPHRTIHKSTIPGAPLRWRWSHLSSADSDAREHIARYELLVTTEAVPLISNPADFKSDTLHWLNTWVDHAWRNGNGGKGAEVLLYSTWTHWRHSGPPPSYDAEHRIPFRQRLDLQGTRWEIMQDSGNANRPKGMPPIYMIPGHRIIMRIYDDIQAGTAPGMASVGEIFSDDIHLNNLGQYVITCLVYAVIYHRDPRELPDKLDLKEDKLTPEQAKYFKAIAWEVATSYSRAGVPAK